MSKKGAWVANGLAALAIAALATAEDGPPTSQPEQSQPEAPGASRLAPPPPAAEMSDEARDLHAELEFFNPELDGFDTEVLSGATDEVLHFLSELLPSEVLADSVAPLLFDNFECTDLRPDDLVPLFAKRGLRVDAYEPVKTIRARGPQALATALTDLSLPFDGEEFRIKFKTVEVTAITDDVYVTTAIYLAMGTGRDGYVQQNARWEMRWDVRDGFDRPRLRGIRVTEFQENTARGQLYQDCTQSVLADDRVLDRIRRGVHSWWGRMDTGMGFSFYGDYGVALGDVDGDDLDDVYLCQPGSIPNLLLRHNTDGTVTDISAGSGLDLLNDTPSALIADFDNDGNQDIVVATLLYLMVMKGDGAGHFVLTSEIPIDNTTSLSAADYDRDGRLDLYVCRYSASGRANVSGESIYDSNKGRPNALLRNEGDLAFRDATVESGIDHNNTKFSFASVWEDYDNDGDADLYVANDFGRNNLYRNDDGHFRDVATDVGAEDMAAGMGAAWSDFDQDGDMDMYVSNMFSSAGGRIVDKAKISERAGAEAISPLERFAKGNTLLRNNGDGTFTDISTKAGITMGRWAWAGEFADINNDGWPDLIVPNGFVTNTNKDDL